MSAVTNVVFLDIDGVLNSRRSAWARTEIGELDPSACARLQRLCDESHAAIVVSSAWRLVYGLPRTVARLRAAGLRAPVVGETPHLPNAARGVEIGRWLARSAPTECPSLSGMVILDDIEAMALLAPWLVLTTDDVGLTDEHVDMALEVLARPLPLIDRSVRRVG